MNAADKAIKAFDASDAMNQLRDKMKLAFMELIPEEQMKEMLRTEFEKFVKPQKRPGYNSSYEEPSVFSKLAQAVLGDVFRDALREELSRPKWESGFFNDGFHTPSAMVQRYLADHHDELARVAINLVLGNAIEEVLSQIREKTQRGVERY